MNDNASKRGMTNQQHSSRSN